MAARPHLIEGLGVRYIERLSVFGGRAWHVPAAPQWSRLLRCLRLRCLRLRCLRLRCLRDEGCAGIGSAGSGSAGIGSAVRLRNCGASCFLRARSERSEHKQIWRPLGRHRFFILGVFFMIKGIAEKVLFSPMTLMVSNQP